MTDQPTDPTEQTPPPEAPDAPGAPGSGAAPPLPQPASPAAEPAAPAAPAASPPPAAPAGPPPPPVPPGAAAPWNPVPQPGPPVASPTVPQAYAQPGYPQQAPPPAANPYGGYSQAPVYAGGGGPGFPGSLAFVEQNFGKVASFGQRALAYLVDMALTLIGLVPMILGIILIAVAVPSDISTDQFGNPTSSGDGNGALAAVGGLLIALGVLVAIGITIWNRVFKMGRTGQSVGKKVIGLYLLDDKTGQPIGAGMCFLREIVNSLINQVIYLGWLWMLWDDDKQTLGDKSVHSTVVIVPKR